MGTFGERLRDAMISSGVGVATMARKCGVSRQTVARWFRMKTADLSGTHLLIAAELVSMRPRWLGLGIMPMLTAAPAQERNAKLSAAEH